MNMTSQNRGNELKSCLRKFSAMAAQMVTAHPDILNQTLTPFETVASLWLLDETTPNFADIENAKAQYKEHGFDGESVVTEINGLLAKDEHLNKCCAGKPWPLLSWVARFVDRFAIGITDEFPEARFEQDSELFIEITYQRPFAVHLYRRLYNFKAELPTIDFGRFEIVRLDSSEIRRMLRDENVFQMFHLQGTGDHYLHSTIPTDPVLDESPMQAAQDEALDAIAVIRYFKDGYVDSDYFLTFYEPSWVNSVRRVTPFGRIFSIPYADGNRNFTLSADEAVSLREWMELYFGQVHQHLLDRGTSDMGKRLAVATEFFASSFSEGTEEKRLIDLMVALEALFSPNDKAELSFKICLYAAQLVGSTPADRADNFKFLKKIYGMRSEFVHGTLPIEAYLANEFISSEDNDRLASILRQAILRLLALSLNGRSDLAKGKNPVHSDLAIAVFDPIVAETIRESSDPEIAIESLRSKRSANGGTERQA